MMMERAKTAPAPSPPPEETKKTTTAVSVVAVAGGGVSEEEQRIRDLERRLKSLDGVDEGAVASSASTPVVIPPPQQASVASSSSSAAKNDPLLKRIQAAQERTRLAEQREREAAASLIAAEAERKRMEEDAIAAEEERSRIRRAQDALRSVAGRALEDKQRQAFTTTTTMPGAASMAVPIMKSMDPPPPSFDSMKFPPPMMSFSASSASDGPAMMVGHGMNSRALTREEAPRPPPPPPPSFDFMIAPSAPPITPTEEGCESDHLLGVMPIAAPTLMPEMPQQQHRHQHQHVQVDAPPPPSFAEFESLRQSSHSTMTSAAPAAELEESGSSIFDYDDAGNPMSPERRRALLDEQRLLYEQIMTEKAANDEAIARANADLFDMKSSTSAARAMPGGEDSLAARMDWVGRDVASGAVADAVGKNGTGDGVVGTSMSTSSSSTGRMVKIGNNQMVALHGQDRTKKAIKEGTAILVQCINCQNWMQVTDTASLMFCPVCQVVSPVIKQSEVLTKEEAIQLTMDRKLAEKLQAEYNNHDIEDDAEEGGGGKSADDEGYLARFFGSGVSKYPAARVGKSSPTAQTEGADSSWWDKITSIVSHGVADEDPKERGELGVTRPPGTASRQRRGAESSSSASSSPVAVHDRVAGRDEETTGLLGPVVVDGNEANLPAARVAEQRPLFSCVMDSVSSATSALWSSTGEGDREGNVYGVDASSLLVTNAGRGVGDGAGDYAQLSDRE